MSRNREIRIIHPDMLNLNILASPFNFYNPEKQTLLPSFKNPRLTLVEIPFPTPHYAQYEIGSKLVEINILPNQYDPSFFQDPTKITLLDFLKDAFNKSEKDLTDMYNCIYQREPYALIVETGANYEGFFNPHTAITSTSDGSIQTIWLDPSKSKEITVATLP